MTSFLSGTQERTGTEERKRQADGTLVPEHVNRVDEVEFNWEGGHV